MSRIPVRVSALVALAIVLTAVSGGLTGTRAKAIPATLVVPTDYATIQAAVDAAAPGDTVEVGAGSYPEQLRIEKDLTLMGAGMDLTVIRAPNTLLPGELPTNAIVEIFAGATVSMSRLTVAGPGSGTCKNGALRHGIRVLQQAHLEFSFAAVRDIHDSQMAECLRSGTAILAGSAFGPPASLVVHHTEITNFQNAGIIVLGVGSWASITHNTVAGPGEDVGTNGVEVAAGAVGTISHNVVSGNVCPRRSKLCGEDFFSEFQNGGIVAGGGGPGTVITHNLLIRNQIGMFLSEADEIAHNVVIDSEYFGIGLVGVDHGFFTITGGEITGGGGGVWVVPLPPVDMTIVLNKVEFSGLSGPAVEELECLGATATVVGGPPSTQGDCPF